VAGEFDRGPRAEDTGCGDKHVHGRDSRTLGGYKTYRALGEVPRGLACRHS
jgi:hypothetical protein